MNGPTIIANGCVVTCDPMNRGGQFSLLVRDGRIAAIAEDSGVLTSLHPHATVVDARNKLIIPGFVNAHVHSESILFRNRTDGVHYTLWNESANLRDCVDRLVAPGSDDDIRSVYLAAHFTHLKCGTTCVGEFGPSLDGKGFAHLLQAIERTDVKSVVTLQNWDQIRCMEEKGKKRPPCMVSLGKEDEFTVYSFENLVRAAKELKVPLVASVAEQREDVEWVRKNFQKNILTLLHDYDALHLNTLLVHLNHITERDVEIIGEMGLTVVVCGQSAAKKQTGFPSLRSLLAQNARLCIGTDWGNLDMVSEMQFLYQLPLLVPGLRTFSPLELLRMATINGAFALGLSAETGSIEQGKRADLAFFDLTDIRLPVVGERPTARDLSELLIRYLSAKNVSDVMINGEFFLRQGQIMTMVEDDIVAGFRATCNKFFPNGQSTVSEISAPVEGSKILPFVPYGRPSTVGGQGFEEGTSAAEEQQGFDSINLRPPNSVSNKERQPLRHPVISKDVKHVFGEDDEV